MKEKIFYRNITKNLFKQYYKAEDRWETKPVKFWNEILDKGKECFNLSALLEEFKFDKDLGEFDLANMVFKNVSFANINLSGCDFSNCDVSYANFTRATVKNI